MNDQPDQPDPDAPSTQPLPSQPEHRVLPPDPALQQEGTTPPRQRFVDRLWTLRAVIAVALASVILGGLGGAALANAAGDDGDHRPGPGNRFRHNGPMNPPPSMRPWGSRPGQGQGQGHGQGPGQGPGMGPGGPGTATPTPAKPTPTR